MKRRKIGIDDEYSIHTLVGLLELGLVGEVLGGHGGGCVGMLCFQRGGI
jgi:hypothetical protein